jgi:hypothetical protein
MLCDGIMCGFASKRDEKAATVKAVALRLRLFLP